MPSARPSIPPPPEKDAEQEKPRSIPIAVPFAGSRCSRLRVALFLAIPKLMKPKPPALYIDMGNRRFDPAGLGGRLIARWEGSATYQLTIDPLEPQQLAGFRAVAADPPHPLSLVIRLNDAAGLVACQKEIVLPAPQTADDAGPAKVLLAGQDAWRRHRAIRGWRGRQACGDRFERRRFPVRRMCIAASRDGILPPTSPPLPIRTSG